MCSSTPRKKQRRHVTCNGDYLFAPPSGEEEHVGDNANRPLVGKRTRSHRRAGHHPERIDLTESQRALESRAAGPTGAHRSSPARLRAASQPDGKHIPVSYRHVRSRVSSGELAEANCF